MCNKFTCGCVVLGFVAKQLIKEEISRNKIRIDLELKFIKTKTIELGNEYFNHLT